MEYGQKKIKIGRIQPFWPRIRPKNLKIGRIKAKIGRIMKVNAKKMAVLDCLRAQKDPVSLSNLLLLLGDAYNSRTVRRWLSEFAETGHVEKIGKKKATRYYAVGVRTQEEGFDFTKASQASIQYVRQPLFQRKPIAYRSSWLEDYQPNVSAYFNEKMKKTLHQAGQRAKTKEPAGTYARHIYNRLLIDLSYHSSRLEGNTYSLIETERLLLEGESAPGKLDEEKVMILNHKEAIRHLVDNADKMTIDETSIYTLHYLLSDGLVASQYAGAVRDHGVRIGGSTYVPSEDPIYLKNQLKLICQKASLINDPYEQSIFLLIHLSYLQAFHDINKRTARLSANIPLVKNNLVPLSFNDLKKEDYASAILAIYECNDPLPLIELYLFSYSRTCQLYDVTFESLGFDAIRIRYREERRNIVRYIIENQIVSDALDVYIHTQATALLPEEQQSDFIEDIYEDLTEIGPHRIAGLGVSLQQLNAWLKKSDHRK